jgi:hypothetical protein
MKDGMKYIVYDNDQIPVSIIIFPMFIKHDDMWRNFQYQNNNSEVISAGFIKIDNNQFFCHGKSIGLGVSARVEDSILANNILKL